VGDKKIKDCITNIFSPETYLSSSSSTLFRKTTQLLHFLPHPPIQQTYHKRRSTIFEDEILN
jgi:hypothetical protein